MGLWFKYTKWFKLRREVSRILCLKASKKKLWHVYRRHHNIDLYIEYNLVILKVFMFYGLSLLFYHLNVAIFGAEFNSYSVPPLL